MDGPGVHLFCTSTPESANGVPLRLLVDMLCNLCLILSVMHSFAAFLLGQATAEEEAGKPIRSPWDLLGGIGVFLGLGLPAM